MLSSIINEYYKFSDYKQETIEATDINTFKRFFDKKRKTRMDLFMD